MPIFRATQPKLSTSAPGGTTEMMPFFPLSFALIENEPFGDFLICTDFTDFPLAFGLSPFGSLYLYPRLLPSTLQKGLPLLLVPDGSTKAPLLDVAPLTKMVKMAPPALPPSVGLPTMVFPLDFSLPEAVTFR